jgi:hypothetical protein
MALKFVLVMCSLAISANARTIGERSELEQLREALRIQEDDQSQSTIERKEEDGGSVCASCPAGTECCQVDGGARFQCCSKTYYVGAKEKVTFDREKNLAIYNMPDGSIHVADFNKGLSFRFDKPARKCYIAPGLDYTLEDIIAVAEQETQENKGVQLTSFKESDAKPIQDQSLVPEVLKDLCKDVPLSWH